jgi:hypothetical protein
VALADAEVVEEPAVDLQLRNGTDAEAEAKGRNPPQIPFQPGHRIELIVGEVEAAFDQDATRADGLGILRDERPLLRRCRMCECQNQRGGQCGRDGI